MNKININKEGRYFRSSDFYLCCFIYAKGGVLVGIDKENPKRAIFSFETSFDIEQLAEDYLMNREILIAPKTLAFAIRELKDKIYSQPI